MFLVTGNLCPLRCLLFYLLTHQNHENLWPWHMLSIVVLFSKSPDLRKRVAAPVISDDFGPLFRSFERSRSSFTSVSCNCRRFLSKWSTSRRSSWAKALSVATTERRCRTFSFSLPAKKKATEMILGLTQDGVGRHCYKTLQNRADCVGWVLTQINIPKPGWET